MPRVNRLSRAVEHPNPIVGCIMVIQEKLKFFGRALVRCQCPEYERQVAQLREELSVVREQFQAQRMELRFLRVHGQETLERFRSRITTLLQVNTQRLTLQRHQERAIRWEIQTLRQTVHLLVASCICNDVDVPTFPVPPWRVDLASHPFSWEIPAEWDGPEPDFDPNSSPVTNVASGTNANPSS